MKKSTVLTGLILSLLPLSVFAAPTKPAHKAPVKKAAAMYECQKCHMKVSAAVAKKDGYKDPMDGGALVPVKPSTSPSKPMGDMKM